MTEFINPEGSNQVNAADINAVAILGFTDMSLLPDDEAKPIHRPDVSDEKLGEMIRDALEELYGPVGETDPAEVEKFLKSIRDAGK